MKAVVCRSYEGVDAATLEDISRPELIPGAVRIKVLACSASFASLLVMKGQHQNRAPLPLIPGTEVAGIVTHVGENVEHFRPGDRVIAGVPSGGYAQEVVALEKTVFALPEDIDFDIGAQLPTIYGTAYGALIWRAKLQPHEVILVHGSTGGSGLAALQIAQAFGATVMATVGSEKKAHFLRTQGIEHVFNYKTTNWRQEVLKRTEQRGADVIYDPVGGDFFKTSLRCIAPEGRLVTMGFASGNIPTIPANIVLVKNIDIIGVYWGYYFGWGKNKTLSTNDAKLRAAYIQLFEWVLQNKIKPHTHAILPLSKFKTALHMITSREVLGRVIMRPW